MSSLVRIVGLVAVLAGSSACKRTGENASFHLQSGEAQRGLSRFTTEERAILEEPDSVTVYRLAAPVENPPAGFVEHRAMFHGFPVERVTTARRREDGIWALVKIARGVAAHEGNTPSCFTPRHGLSAVRDGKRVELTISYECQQLQIFGPEEVAASAAPRTTIGTADASHDVNTTFGAIEGRL